MKTCHRIIASLLAWTAVQSVAQGQFIEHVDTIEQAELTVPASALFAVDSARNSTAIFIGSREFHAPSTGLGDRVYVLDANTNALVDILDAPNQTDGFGDALAATDQLLVVGAPLADAKEGIDNQGRVYLYDLAARAGDDGGSPIATIDAPADVSENGYFGNDVAIDGNRVIIGSRDNRAWRYDIEKLELVEFMTTDVAPNDLFGFSVGIEGSTAIVGAPLHDVGARPSIGSVYVYDTITMTQIRKLIPGGATEFTDCGISVDIDSGVIAVGCPGSPNSDDQRTAYIYDAATGEELMRLVRPEPPPSEESFGRSVTLDGARCLVSAPFDFTNGLLHTGTIYVFDLTTGGPIGSWTIPGGAVQANLGFNSMLMDGTTLFVPSSESIPSMFSFGRLRQFTITAGACCTADGCLLMTADDCVDTNGVFEGVGTVCSASTCSEPEGGACCAPAGCVDGFNPQSCEQIGGVYLGLASTCDAVVRCDVVPCQWDCMPVQPNGQRGNQFVNVDDLIAVIIAFGGSDVPFDVSPIHPDGTWGNGIVNVNDIIDVINNFGYCPYGQASL
ncbi:MAG: FG-GAP repeat protein [Planctomycetota bacterium]